MKLSRQPGSALPDPSSNTSPQVFLDLFRNASSQTLAWTAVAVAVAWVPVAVLSALRGGGAFPSFLTDYAMQSRLLIVIPVLILSAPALHERRSQVAQHIETFLVPRNQHPKFHDDWTSNDELRNSWFARILIVALVYVTVIWLDRYLSPNGAEFTGWWKGGGGLRFMSPAGTWAAFVSYPVLLLLGSSLAMAATALVAIPAGNHAPGSSAGCGSPRWPRRSGISRRRVTGTTAFRLLPGSGPGGRCRQSGLSRWTEAGCISPFAHNPDCGRASGLCSALFPVHRHTDADAAPCHVALWSLRARRR